MKMKLLCAAIALFAGVLFGLTLAYGSGLVALK